VSNGETLGQRISKAERQAMNAAVIESNYKGGEFFAPMEFKGDGDGDIHASLGFAGFANTGRADLGNDIVDPRAFSRATLSEFLKFGRQLFFMHSRYEQVGEITAAKVVPAGQRSMFGITDGGLLVEGFIDSPIDEELGFIPDHEGAKVIHFVRMQVRRNRLKLLSIGWRPTKTEIVKRPDPRRQGEMRNFRLVKALILGEISLVTMAMSPQAMVEATGLKKSFAETYGDRVADALFCDDGAMTPQEIGDAVPEKLADFDEQNVRRIVTETMAKIAASKQNIDKGQYKVVSLFDKDEEKSDGYKIVSL